VSDELDRLTPAERADLDQKHALARDHLPTFVALARKFLREAGGDENLAAGRIALALTGLPVGSEYLLDAALGVAALALVELARREAS